jgi:transposase-like protein
MKFTAMQKAQLVERYQRRESVLLICSETGIPRSTFYSWIPQYSTVEPKAGKRMLNIH